MPQQETVQNNFKAGLKTEFTGLNFPADAATDTQNCIYSLVGDVYRRNGIDYEPDFTLVPSLNFAGVARSSFRWLNAGGDGESQILVLQIGYTLQFFLTSSTTTVAPVSSNYIVAPIDIRQFQAQGNTSIVQQSECQYAAGNGYLFVFHPDCDPFYCVYTPAVAGVSAPTILPTIINLSIRDTIGILEPGVPDSFRPSSLSNEHLYNLLNQGWTLGSGWTGTATIGPTQGIPLSVAAPTQTVLDFVLTSQSSSSVIVVGDEISCTLATCAGTGNNPHVNGVVVLTGTVTGYNGSTGNLNLSITNNSNPALNATGTWSGGNFASTTTTMTLSLVNEGFISKWQSLFNNYPSNSDIWWLYKDTTDTFNPALTGPNVQPATTPAPKGTYIFNPFNQNRAAASGIGGLTTVATSMRPNTGAFYQGRVWYAGVNASQAAQGDQVYTTWTENIYFSQIIETPTDFSKCYQSNDPTSQTLFDLLPTDGGVIQIQGCGAVYKLFPLRFGLLVFASNGIWFISGSTGIGFTATDFSVTKISNIQAISGTSFIDVQGYPFFWNQEGIYQVVPSAQPGSAHSPDIQLDVQNLTLGTILTYYDNIPNVSKTYVRGDYDWINYIVQWCYRSTPETNALLDRYSYDTILNYNLVTKAFYPYTVPVGTTIINSNGTFAITAPIISDIKYVNTPGGAPGPNTQGLFFPGLSPTPAFKYVTQAPINAAITFAEEIDPNYRDFFSNNQVGVYYTSYFVTGYTLPGQALRKIQIPYVYIFSRNPNNSICSIQAIWDYVGSTNTGKESTRQTITMKNNQFYRKVRLRGRGMAVQLKVSSIQGQGFDIMGWSVLDQINQVV